MVKLGGRDKRLTVFIIVVEFLYNLFLECFNPQKWSPHYFVLNHEKLSFTTPEDKVEDGDSPEEQEVQIATPFLMTRPLI